MIFLKGKTVVLKIEDHVQLSEQLLWRRAGRTLVMVAVPGVGFSVG